MDAWPSYLEIVSFLLHQPRATTNTLSVYINSSLSPTELLLVKPLKTVETSVKSQH